MGVRGQEGWRKGVWEEKGRDRHGMRKANILKFLPRILRHRGARGMMGGGVDPIGDVLNHRRILNEKPPATRDDILAIVERRRRSVHRFDRAIMRNTGEDTIRAAQGHSLGLGVVSDGLPIRVDFPRFSMGILLLMRAIL